MELNAKERAWLATHDERGCLNKAVAHKGYLALAPLFHAGYIRNVGPDNPAQWDLRITEAGRTALAATK